MYNLISYNMYTHMHIIVIFYFVAGDMQAQMQQV